MTLTGLALAAFGLGAWSGSAHALHDTPLQQLAGRWPRCEVRGVVAEQAGGLGTLVRISELRCGATTLVSPGTVILPPTDAGGGTAIVATGLLAPLDETDPYDLLRYRRGALARLEPDHVAAGSVHGTLLQLADRLRLSLRAASSGLASDEAALFRGLATGDTEGMAPVVEDAMRAAGLTHLVAVSGSNVAIVVAAVSLCVRRFSPGARFVAGACALGMFVLVAGPEPSVLRAAAMAAIAMVALAGGGRVNPLNTLGLALVVVVALRPGLVFSAGLQLSAAATAGICLWARPVEERLRRVPRPLRAPLAVTLAAQFAVSPILVSVFGQFSVTGPVANLLAVPAVPPATILAVAAAIAGLVSPPVAALCARVAAPLTSWILTVAGWFGTPAWAMATLPGWSAPLLGAAVAAAAWASLRRAGRTRPAEWLGR